MSNWNCSISAIKECSSKFNPVKRRLNPAMLNAMKYISSEAKEYGEDNWDALQERQIIQPKYTTLADLWRLLNIPAIKPSRNSWWRLTPVINGYIHGLPSLCGLLIATDGMICLVLKENGQTFTAHLDNFVATEQLEMKSQDFDSYNGKFRIKALVGKKSPKPTRKVNIEEFC